MRIWRKYQTTAPQRPTKQRRKNRSYQRRKLKLALLRSSGVTGIFCQLFRMPSLEFGCIGLEGGLEVVFMQSSNMAGDTNQQLSQHIFIARGNELLVRLHHSIVWWTQASRFKFIFTNFLDLHAFTHRLATNLPTFCVQKNTKNLHKTSS